MILFKNIKYKNFLSTGNQYTEIDFTKNKTNLIVGTNGAGKSTVLDALTFSLFGKPFRKINKPQLANSVNEKDCRVEIEFTIGSIDWKVVRGIKPAVFEIWRNNSVLDQASAALITDLKQRGLLDETLVIWGGEFGRTNYCQGKIAPENYGRDHHPRCFSMWMAGGGIKGGTLYGETCPFGYNIVDKKGC